MRLLNCLPSVVPIYISKYLANIHTIVQAIDLQPHRRHSSVRPLVHSVCNAEQREHPGGPKGGRIRAPAASGGQKAKLSGLYWILDSVEYTGRRQTLTSCFGKR